MKLAGRVSQIQPSATLAAEAKAKALRAQGVDVISFSAGEPDFDTPEWVKEAAVKALQEGFTKYTPPSGTLELKQAVVEKMAKDHGLTYEPSQVLISCGAKHSLYNIAQALFEAGDEVIIPSPYWVSYPDQVRLNDATPVFIETREEDDFLLRPEDLEQAITPRTKALILNSPANPTGGAYERAHLQRIAEIAVRRNLLVISDEIYEKILYDGFPHVSIASLGPEMQERTIVVNGLSKAYSMTGWRIGYAVGPKEIIDAMGKIQSQSTSNPNSIAQKGAVAALKGDPSFTEMMVSRFDNRRKYIVERLNRIPGVTCRMPKGAFYVFPRVTGILGKSFKGKTISNTVQLAEYLLDEAKVAVICGDPFGAPGYLRLSYATAMKNIEKGMDRIEEALR
ncbi:MAG: pyridoxal phosphate-dependent aminotransferase [Nitrospirae bacterium]|nr:pyridoxal phosphate-dependent aminotransferase [Nitrospirota bacterium]